MQRGVRAFGIRRKLGGDVDKPDNDDQQGEQASLGDAERDERIAEHQQAVAGNEERGGRDVGEQLSVRPTPAEGGRQQHDYRERADRDREVPMAAIRLLDPRSHRPYGKGGERDFDGKLKD